MEKVIILLVEEESLEAKELEQKIEGFGYKVPYIISTFEELVNKASDITPDLILIEISLKGNLNNIEMVNKIKKLDIPLIYLTDYSINPLIFEKTIITDPYGYIIKPYNNNQLKYTIELALYRHKKEKKIKENEKKYRKIFNNEFDMIHINRIKNGVPGKFIEVNNVGIERLGYKYDEFLNMTPTDITAYENRSEIQKNALNIFEKGYYEFDIIQQAKDGRKIPVEVKSTLIELNGEKVVLSITRDITESKKAEKALEESEKKYRDLAELLPQTIFETDLNGNITFVNHIGYQIFGYTPEELNNGINMIQILVPEDRERAMKNNQRIINGEQLPFGEFTALKKDGTIFPIIVNTNPIIYENKIIGLRGILVNITELKDAENKIKASLKDKEVLLKEVHHRVKNNMQIISSLLNLQIDYLNDEDAVDVLKESQNRVKSMAMIHEKLYLSKDLTQINFANYIQNLVSNLFCSYNIKESQINPILKIEDVNLNIETAIPCGLIINELISNCLKYAFPNQMKGEIIIALKSVGDKFELIISDNGIGLPENFNINNIKTLGILLVKSLTEQIDGKISIHGKHGTQFKITFKELKYTERI
jgi:PAS domain S-box-containing protein